ncbi:S41 family peptidase [Vagococcus hydrophili]|nr:S41 family peptidase [Vagococcus hydrophili]
MTSRLQTYSASENFIINFFNTKRATLIGTTTAGSTGQPALFKLKTGGYFIITAKKVEVPNGIGHHNLGIKSDVLIQESLEDRKNGIDTVIDYALEN